jgi:hypothetical protein
MENRSDFPDRETKIDLIFRIIESGLKNGIAFELIAKVAGELFDYKVKADDFEAVFQKGILTLTITNKS